MLTMKVAHDYVNNKNSKAGLAVGLVILFIALGVAIGCVVRAVMKKKEHEKLKSSIDEMKKRYDGKPPDDMKESEDRMKGG